MAHNELKRVGSRADTKGPFLLMASAAASIAILYVGGIRLPIAISAIAVVAGTLAVIQANRRGRIGLFTIFVYAVFSSSFIHIFEYLTFSFGTEDPRRMWGIPTNPYMIDEATIQTLAMMAATASLGFAASIYLLSPRGPFGPATTLATTPLPTRTLSRLASTLWAGAGLAIGLIRAPQMTLFSAQYNSATSNNSALASNLDFASLAVFGYAAFTFAYVDALLDQDARRRRFKLLVVLALFAVSVLRADLLTGNREQVPFAGAFLLLFLICRKRVDGRRASQALTLRVLVILGLVFLSINVASNLVGALRYELVGVTSLGDVTRKLEMISERRGQSIWFDPGLYLSGTWTGGTLTMLSVAGDDQRGLMPLRYGETYGQIVASLPPGFVASALGYQRPIEADKGPAYEMRYGQGGTHATVVPFMNFSMPGVLIASMLIGGGIALLDRRVNRKVTVPSLSLLGMLMGIAPWWIWYGEKLLINAALVWLLMLFAYRLSASQVTNACIADARPSGVDNHSGPLPDGGRPDSTNGSQFEGDCVR